MKRRFKTLLAAALIFTTIFSIASPAADNGVVPNTGGLVIEGKDGWLFYTGDNTIGNYHGTDLYSLSELESIEQKLGVFRDALEERGCEFVILIAPNREQVYYRNMPAYYGEPASFTRAQQVTDYLRSKGFRVVYPVEELKEAVEEYPEYDFYYRTDSHWNELGAYVGAKALMAELGIEMSPVEDLVIEPIPHESQDISNILMERLMDIGYNVYGYTDHEIESFDDLSAFVHHTTNSEQDERKVLLVGDSFALSLYPYIGQEFNDVTACNDKTLDIPDLLYAVEPDIYVYEVVERFLDLMETGEGLEVPYQWLMEDELSASGQEDEYDQD